MTTQNTPAPDAMPFEDGWFIHYEPETSFIALSHPSGGKRSVCECNPVWADRIIKALTRADHHTALEQENKDLKRERNLAQRNFEYYFDRYITITGKSLAEVEREWALRTDNAQSFPQARLEQVARQMAKSLSPEVMEFPSTLDNADFVTRFYRWYHAHGKPAFAAYEKFVEGK